MSVPNQKVVYIHKRKYTGNFLQIGIDEMRLAQQQMTYCEFVLYLYLAGNANGFKLELSQQAFENATGYKKTAYHNAVDTLLKVTTITMSSTPPLFAAVNSILEFYLTENLCRPKKQKNLFHQTLNSVRTIEK